MGRHDGRRAIARRMEGLLLFIIPLIDLRMMKRRASYFSLVSQDLAGLHNAA
jgi:hypothetical protein